MYKRQAYTAQIDADGVLRDLDTGEKKRFISHPNSYNIVESIEEESLNLPERTFIEWLRFAPRKETKTVVKDTYNSTRNHRLYVLSLIHILYRSIYYCDLFY